MKEASRAFRNYITMTQTLPSRELLWQFAKTLRTTLNLHKIRPIAAIFLFNNELQLSETKGLRIQLSILSCSD